MDELIVSDGERDLRSDEQTLELVARGGPLAALYDPLADLCQSSWPAVGLIPSGSSVVRVNTVWE